MKTDATAFQSLELWARTQGDGVAVQVSGGTARSAVTWNRLRDEVEVCAAGLSRAGLHAGHVVLGAMTADVRALVLQHAVRTVGATVVWVHPDVGAGELATLLDGASVRFVVVSDDARLASWDGLDLGVAEVLRMDGDGLGALRALGVERLREAPSLLQLLDLHADSAVARPRILTPGSGLRALAPTVLPADLTLGDTVLLVGDMADPHVQDGLARHLDSGSALALVHGVPDLVDLLSTTLSEALEDAEPFAPTVLRFALPDDLAMTEAIRLRSAREVPRGDARALPQRRRRPADDRFASQGPAAPSPSD